MGVNGKRFTIAISDELAVQLDRMKQRKYYNTSQNKIVQDLLWAGLESMKKDLDSLNNNVSSNDARAEP